MNTEPVQQYADRPPRGYRLASNKQTITPSDLVFFSSSDKRDADWVRPRIGEGIIGTCVQDHWPTVMGLAVPAK